MAWTLEKRQGTGDYADELLTCVEGAYLWHAQGIQYACNEQQGKHKHSWGACVSPGGIRQWNNFFYQRTTLFYAYTNTGLQDLIAADQAMLDQWPDKWMGEELRRYVRFGLGKWFSIS
jgi:hypothetical protein